MSADVSYLRVNDRRLLRFAIWQAWGRKCYWCDAPKNFSEVEIDHIVPKGLEAAKFKQALQDYGLPATYDLHDPRNLAPICGICNGAGRKSSNTYVRAAVVLDHLRKAASLRGAVVRTVLNFKKGGDVAKALLDLASADTTIAEVRDLFVEYFPAVASTAASINQGLLDLPVFRDLDIDRGFPVRLDLSSEFVRDLWLLEDFLGCDLDAALDAPIAGLLGQLAVEMDGALQNESEFEPVDVGPPVPYAFDVRVVSIEFPNRFLSDDLEVEVKLSFNGGLTCSASRYSDAGDERLELQGEAEVSGTALVNGTWSTNGGLGFYEEVTVEGLEIEASIE